MEINYLAVLVCAVLAMVIGALWYGPLFGNMWLRVIGATEMDLATRAAMQKKAMPLYVVQFLLTLFQVFVLAEQMAWGGWKPQTLGVSIFIFLGYVMPTIAASCMWNNDSRKIAWTRFLIQAGYQLVVFVLFGLILQMWV